MNKVKELINKIPKPVKNRYTLTLLFFFLWIVFIDDYNLIKQYNLKKEVTKLQNLKKYYLEEIKKDSTEYHQIKKNKQKQEKFAREKFLMKKDNEDIFIIKNKK